MGKILKTISKFSLVSILFGCLLASQASAISGSAATFSDVGVGSEYYDAVSYLHTGGIVSGYADGTFEPYQTINRAEFTKIIVGATGYDPAKDPSGFDIYSTSGMNFSDIQKGAWYNPYLRKAIGIGVIEGYPDGTFKPAQEINFAEASKIIVVSTGGNFAGAGYAPEDWFHKFVNILEQDHAIPNTILSFDQKITRGEMAEILYRMKKQVTNKPSLGYADLATAKGYLNGNLSYPADGLPADLKVCAENSSDSSKTFCSYHRISDAVYLYGFGYNLAVPAGTYHVYLASSVSGTELRGLYSEFVKCGMDATHCPSHALVDVTVTAGKTEIGIDPADWYSGA